MLVDSHCHITFSEFDEDRADVIANAKKAGVKWMIVPGDNVFSSNKAVELANSRPDCIRAAVGCHPYETQKNPDITAIESILRAPGVVAVGEIGLDYHIYKGFPAAGKKDDQKQLFESQLRLAVKYDLPVIIHCRDAYMDVFDVLDSLPTMPRGVFHCFSGSTEDAKRVTERGMLMGFDGNITFSKTLKTLIPQLPIETMMIETDSPYLTPEPHRGSRNEPKYVTFVAREIAKLKDIPPSTVHDITTLNAKTLFSLP